MNLDNNPQMHIQPLEVCKFVGIQNSTEFPNITAVYTDTNGDTETTIFPKVAILTYQVGSSSTSISAINFAPFGNNAGSDAFARLRTSSPTTLFNCKLLFDKAPTLFSEAVSGAYNSAFSVNNACVTMTTSGANSYVIRQSKVRPNYQPGKSQLALVTGVLGPSVSGLISRMGLFTSLSAAPYNTLYGFYIENNGGAISLNIATLGNTPSVSIPQSAWNIDKLNGTGPSGYNIDFTKALIFQVDFAWLGIGRVRFGIVINGFTIYVHEERHFNSLTDVYLSIPNLPIRYEIRQTGANGGTMKQICCTIISEGGEQNYGTVRSIDVGNTATAITSNDSLALLVIRTNPAKIASFTRLKKVNVAPKGTTAAKIELLLNAEAAGPAYTWTDVPNSNLQYAIGTSTNIISAHGTQLQAGFFGKQGTGITLDLGEITTNFGSSIDGTVDTITVSVTPLGSNDDYWGSIDWVDLG